MKDCLYFTRRAFGENGKVTAWTFRKMCPKCKKAKMGKPIVKGKVKSRSPTYVCPECGHEEQKKEHEESLEVNIRYTCPSCGHNGETIIPYERKKWQGVDAFVFQCEKCREKLGVTKKMKAPKK